ncbi:MAG: hypothetical protein ACE5JN_00130 [Candidatus Methylomirabilia bacterium]
MWQKTDKSQARWLPPLAILLVVMLLALVVSYSPRAITEAAARESGPIERATLLLYLAGAATLSIFATYKRRGSGYAASFVFLLFGLRELDFNSRFTTQNIEKCLTLCFFLSPDVPVSEKIIVGTALLILAAILLKLIANYGPGVIKAIRAGRPYAISMLSGTLLLPVSQVFDECAHFLRRRVVVYDDVVLACALLGEVLELAVPLLFLLAFLQWTNDASAMGKPQA